MDVDAETVCQQLHGGRQAAGEVLEVHENYVLLVAPVSGVGQGHITPERESRYSAGSDLSRI